MITNVYSFSYLGGPGGPLRRTQVNENFRAVIPHQQGKTRPSVWQEIQYFMDSFEI